jgi:hypothetical protein
MELEINQSRMAVLGDDYVFPLVEIRISQTALMHRSNHFVQANKEPFVWTFINVEGMAFDIWMGHGGGPTPPIHTDLSRVPGDAGNVSQKMARANFVPGKSSTNPARRQQKQRMFPMKFYYHLASRALIESSRRPRIMFKDFNQLASLAINGNHRRRLPIA